VFNPKHKSAAMRARLSDGHPEAPLLVYVGRLGAEKNTEALKDILQQVATCAWHQGLPIRDHPAHSLLPAQHVAAYAGGLP
jgi:hypothetical protein